MGAALRAISVHLWFSSRESLRRPANTSRRLNCAGVFYREFNTYGMVGSQASTVRPLQILTVARTHAVLV
jgi:hypothetical protein